MGLPYHECNVYSLPPNTVIGFGKRATQDDAQQPPPIPSPPKAVKHRGWRWAWERLTGIEEQGE